MSDRHPNRRRPPRRRIRRAVARFCRLRGVSTGRGISPVVGIALLIIILVMLSMTVGLMLTGFEERLEPVDILAEGQCAGDRVVEFDGDVNAFHDDLSKKPCVLWLDASHVETDGSKNVHTWIDRGPNGFDARQTNTSLQPRLQNGPGINEPAVRFHNASGVPTGDVLVIDRDTRDLNVAGDAEITVIAFIHTKKFDRGGPWSIGEAGAAGREFSMRTCGGESCPDDGSPKNHWRAQLWDVADIDFVADNSHNEWIVMTQMYDGSDTVIRVDGEELEREPTDLDLSENRNIQIGRWERLENDSNYDHYYYYNGYMAEVLIFDRALSPEELDAVESYMLEKYN